MKRMSTIAARALVGVRGAYFRLTGRPAHRSGLTVPCKGRCGAGPHDAHLGRGALTVLARVKE